MTAITAAVVNGYLDFADKFYATAERINSIRERINEDRSTAYITLISEPTNAGAILLLKQAVASEDWLVRAAVNGIAAGHSTMDGLQTYAKEIEDVKLQTYTIDMVRALVRVLVIYQKLVVLAIAHNKKDKDFVANPSPQTLGLALENWQREQTLTAEIVSKAYEEKAVWNLANTYKETTVVDRPAAVRELLKNMPWRERFGYAYTASLVTVLGIRSMPIATLAEVAIYIGSILVFIGLPVTDYVRILEKQAERQKDKPILLAPQIPRLLKAGNVTDLAEFRAQKEKQG